jgi:hypothetical protein
MLHDISGMISGIWDEYYDMDDMIRLKYKNDICKDVHRMDQRSNHLAYLCCK